MGACISVAMESGVYVPWAPFKIFNFSSSLLEKFIIIVSPDALFFP